MKLAVWLSSVAVVVALLAMVTMSLLCKILFFYLIGDKPLPLATHCFTHLHWWPLLGALPMFAAAYRVTSAPIVTTERVLVFVSTCTLVILCSLLRRSWLFFGRFSASTLGWVLDASEEARVVDERVAERVAAREKASDRKRKTRKFISQICREVITMFG